MKRSTNPSRRRLAYAIAAALSVVAACKDQAKTASPAGGGSVTAPKGKEHTFRGVVEKIDVATKSLSINGEAVEGWMEAMTMDYSTDNPADYTTLKVGDHITSTVYDGDLTLHHVQVVPAK